MSERFIRCDIEKAVGRVTLDRTARRNALTKELIQELTGHVRAAAENEQVRIIVIAAEGPVFCAGMDLAEMQQRAAAENARQLWQEDAQVYCDLLLSILEAPKPTLAVVQGPAVAGGVGIVLACDLVLAADTAFFSLPEPQRGITASMVTPLLVYRAGAGPASHLLLAGKQVDAATMHRWGICHQVVAEEKLPTTLAENVNSILSGSPMALAATKQQIRQAANIDLNEQLRCATKQSAEARETADAREGLLAFLEKRKPEWE